MTKTFIYMVNGTEFYTEKDIGPEWKEAKALATEEHCEIWRAVVKGENIRYEFYAKGGCFLDEEFYVKGKAEIF